MAETPGEGWITNGLIVFGALGTFVAIGSWLAEDPVVLLAFVAGGGWLLSIPLLVMNRRDAREKREARAETSAVREQKETEIRDLRQQISEWRTIATQDSDSLNRFVARATDMPKVVPRRAHPAADHPPEREPEGGDEH